MQLDEVEPTPHAEVWVKAAYAKGLKVGGGTFSLVLEADLPDHVVKLTRSAADYEALVHFNGKPHFPIVTKHAADQGYGRSGSFYAILMERLPDNFPRDVAPIADYINRIDGFRTHPMGVLKAVERIRRGELETAYPESLADAMEALSDYARQQHLLVELNQRSNWGKRADGTLVLLDLVHTRAEIG